jgi:hypothetical protein
MLVLAKLTDIVYNLCNDTTFENQNLTELKQYEVQHDAILKEEGIARKGIYTTAYSKFDEEEYKQYVAYTLRRLSSLSDILNDTLENGIVDEDPQIVLLRQKALAVVERLISFCKVRFPDVKETEKPVLIEKFTTRSSVPFMAILTKAILHTAGIQKEHLIKSMILLIIHNFSSKKQAKTSYRSFRNNYDRPALGAIKEVIIFLEEMIRYLRDI